MADIDYANYKTQLAKILKDSSSHYSRNIWNLGGYTSHPNPKVPQTASLKDVMKLANDTAEAQRLYPASDRYNYLNYFSDDLLSNNGLKFNSAQDKYAQAIYNDAINYAKSLDEGNNIPNGMNRVADYVSRQVAGIPEEVLQGINRLQLENAVLNGLGLSPTSGKEDRNKFWERNNVAERQGFTFDPWTNALRALNKLSSNDIFTSNDDYNAAVRQEQATRNAVTDALQGQLKNNPDNQSWYQEVGVTPPEYPNHYGAVTK